MIIILKYYISTKKRVDLHTANTHFNDIKDIRYMKRTILAIAATATLAIAASATTVPVKQVHHAGPFRLANPIVIDSVDNAQNKFSAEKLIDTPLAWDATTLLHTAPYGTSQIS